MTTWTLPRLAEGKSSETPTTIKVMPMNGTDMQWRAGTANIRLQG